MIENNNVELLFEARSENEAFARVVAAAFVTYLDPTIEELQDIKTAVSEAVTNAIVHGYDNGPGKVRMRLKGIQNQVIIEVHDDGLGMENVAKAMEPVMKSVGVPSSLNDANLQKGADEEHYLHGFL